VLNPVQDPLFAKKRQARPLNEEKKRHEEKKEKEPAWRRGGKKVRVTPSKRPGPVRQQKCPPGKKKAKKTFAR